MKKARKLHRLTALAALLSVVACSPGGLGFSPTANRPPAANANAQGVDGLLVGHRLMEAGEYDLALKAYLRAASEQGINVDVLSALGSANLKLDRLGQAEQLLRRAVELDPSFVPAQNNLGVVLMERGKVGEARVVFQQAFALDSGQTDSIRENLKLAIARTETTVYSDPEDGPEEPKYNLMRRGTGEYVLLTQL
jgi:tetratricopeptide (TPR) repeat protein